MHELLKRLAPALRNEGFCGSGSNFRKFDGDFGFVINFQSTRDGGRFYTNLGAQPSFIPIEGGGEREISSETLKEYECVFRKRVDVDWSWGMSDAEVARFEFDLLTEQANFFRHAGTFRDAVATEPPDAVLRGFSWGCAEARAALHVARACYALGAREKAKAAAALGLELAGVGASSLRAELHSLVERIANTAAQPANGADAR